jgi:hypothetical protein
MKLLQLEDYVSSVNAETGVTPEMEAGFVRECLDFVEQVSLKFNLSTAVMGMSMHLFHFYSK